MPVGIELKTAKSLRYATLPGRLLLLSIGYTPLTYEISDGRMLSVSFSDKWRSSGNTQWRANLIVYVFELQPQRVSYGMSFATYWLRDTCEGLDPAAVTLNLASVAFTHEPCLTYQSRTW